MEKTFWVYIMATRKMGTLYTGLSSDIVGRAWKHRTGALPGFTKRYRIDRLVWFEEHPEFASAYVREKKIKRWRREWKYTLIEDGNPDWADLYRDLLRSRGFDPDRVEV